MLQCQVDVREPILEMDFLEIEPSHYLKYIICMLYTNKQNLLYVQYII